MEIDIDQRTAMARQFFTEGYNCAQSVAMAYADFCGIDRSTAEKVTLAFGGGLGRQREVCGTVSAAAMVLGAFESARLGSQAKSSAYRLVQEHSEAFRSYSGSIICRDLLSLGKGENDGPEPTPRTEQYYRRRPCAQYVEHSARILGRMLSGLPTE